MNNLKKIFFIVFVFIFSLILFQGCNANCQPLRFAQVSDAHFSTYEKNTSYKLLEKSGDILSDVIQQINDETNVDFVMFSGDMTNQSKKSEVLAFMNYANLLNAPWFITLGNHDVGYKKEISKTEYMKLVSEHNKNSCFPNPYYSFVPKKGYKVIVLDTIIDNKPSSQGYVSKEQLTWLKSEMDKSKNDVIILFSHVPLVEPFPSESHRLTNAYELKILLKKYDNPIVVCSGHYHATKITQEDNILFIETPSLITFPNAFRIIDLIPNNDKLTVNIVFKETRLKDLQSFAKSKCMGSMALYGRDYDRTAVYELPMP